MISTCLIIIIYTVTQGTWAKVKFDKMYSLGDSMSDDGNLYLDLKRKQPDSNLYYEGRYSNGPVWVEYISESVGAKLMNLAYSSATTDNDIFPALHIPDGIFVPGCIQQVQRLMKNYRLEQTEADKSLVTVAFLGNDFFHIYANAKSHVENQEKCIKMLLKDASFNNILIATSSAPELYPAIKLVPSLISAPLFLNKNQEIPKLWNVTISKLRKEYPQINFYNFDFGGVFKDVANGRLFLGDNKEPAYIQSPCLGNIEKLDCPDPDNAMFWDTIHPTTAMHKLLASKSIELIQKKLQVEKPDINNK